MLCKWKFILTNWNNCYFNDTKTEECITINTLLTIISHLHRNLNLDESKSSILEAQTIEDFILEKYPEFRFENGTVKPTNEEEVYMVASLLLYFVCVNSKEVDIKQAMCSKLSPEDQEIIMKFSKCLMEYASVTYKDVHAAILEACGQDIAAGEKVPTVATVAETPPALRSLHGEVRRLQAALDAERFDRNYLQEELARTNLRLEKLQKDKQQYKLDIRELKARISLSGGEGEARGAAGEAEDMTRLRRQLHEAEERLVQAQEQLDDAVYHRDAFKTKMEELKHDRDKWLAVSQNETTRAVQLEEELETERRRVFSLQELVSELRQHHQNNCLDGSQLECDDPDASLHSLHNASVCSEACANVIEVQLGEERAKIVVLRQQIQALQEQLQDLDRKYEDEKLSLEEIITQKDNDICNLKHRINEEIEEKNYMRSHYSDEISKLNNDINELEQKLKENAETSSKIIEQKIQEVQTLQEEKLSLLQSLSDEINKFEDIIKHLKTDLDTEKNLKLKMKEDYENKFVKMNEKVLNRNNELVELQNKICEQSEQIEQLNLDLKNEKECYMNLTNKYNDDTRLLNEAKTAIETSLHQKTEEAKELQRRLIQNVSVFAELNKEIDDLKFVNENLNENQRYLQEAKDSLLAEIQQRDYDVQGIRKEIENITDIFDQERKRFTTKLEEKNAIINTLQTRLHDQTKYKTILEDELKQLRDTKVALSHDIAKLYQDFSTLKVEAKEKDRAMYALDLYLKEERHTNKNLKAGIEKLFEEVMLLTEDVTIKNQEVGNLDEKLEIVAESFKQVLLKKQEALEDAYNKLQNEVEEKNSLHETFSMMGAEMESMSKDYTTRCDELAKLQEEYDKLALSTAENVSEHEDFSVYVTSVLSSGLERLLKSIKKEEIGDEVLQKLISMNEEDEMPVQEKCDLLIKIAETLTIELSLRKNLEKDLKYENDIISDLKEMIKSKELQVLELGTEVKKLQQAIQENQIEFTKQTETYNMTVDSKIKHIQKLQNENKSLTNELNDVKVQLEVKVHSLKEKLIDNENLTDKLKKTYECQIENLNVMVNKLSSYLKEKTMELELVRREKEKLQQHVDESNGAIKTLEEELKNQKLNQQKLIDDFEAERQVLKNMVTVTESIMEDQKVTLSKTIADQEKTVETLQAEKNSLEQLNEVIKKKSEEFVQEKQVAFDSLFKELAEVRRDKERKEKDFQVKEEALNKEISTLKEELAHKQSSVEFLEFQNMVLKKEKEQYQKDTECEIHRLNEQVSVVETLQNANKDLTNVVSQLKEDLLALEEKDNELKIKKDSLETELLNRIDKLSKVLSEDHAKNDKFKSTLQEKLQAKTAVQEKVKVLTDEIIDLVKEKNAYISKLDEVKAECDTNEIKAKEKIEILTEENERLANVTEGNKSVIANLEQVVQHELKRYQKLQEDYAHEKLNLENKCSLLQQYQLKAQKQLQERDREISSLKEQVKTKAHYEDRIENLREEIANKDRLIAKIAEDKDEVIKTLSSELFNEKEKYHKEINERTATISALKEKLEEVRNELKKENDEMIKVIGQRETFAVASQEKVSSHKLSSQTEKELRDRHQVSTPTSDLTHSSMESFKTITDLEKIIHDKNRTITTLQSDITYLKSLMADSENKLLDVTKELDMAKENCDQLSSQLKKIVQQKNEEISDLKKQLTKMSVTENRASQIIKVSAKYQAIILKRIAEIKSNTILKELTNFGNVPNCESELKRSLTTGAITMEDLENFLETTDKHLKRCSEKQTALQKERDRLYEVNKINESEIINLKKFLTELSVCFKTFTSIKDIYTQKFGRVVSIQRTVRREILSLDGQITDATMCKLERGYAAIMQDLSECAMNLERWVERSISRTISAEKIKQAFTSEIECTSLASTSFQNASLEVQFEELENSFHKLIEEVVRAQKGEGARDPQAVTVMEVRAEYEDKLNRMKAKMKQLYQEQIQVFKDKQKEEIAALERELQKTKDKLSESSRAYEEHIKALTTELWSVGEKFLMKKDEAEWLRKKQKSGSLMSLQHMHSSFLATNHEEPPSRPSDTHSLRSLPMHHGAREKRENRALHMSDEEGEVFDNRWLKELSSPRRDGPTAVPGQRLSELKWRNSLCPPHLKSSYPAETQFTQALDEDDIKCTGATGTIGRQQRKEVCITAYKKPGPPTPSKQAGRLSATDSELRESLRPEPEAAPRKTSTPSRLRALFRSARHDTPVEASPRRKLSNMFRKK